MAFIPLPNGARIRWSGLLDGLPWSSRIFAVGPVAPNTTILANLVSAVHSWASASWAPVTSPMASLDLIEAQDWSTHLGVKSEATSTAVGTLASPTGAMPSAIAARIDLVPASGGWRHPGALFHAGIDLSQSAGADTLTSGAITALNSAYAALISAINSAGLPVFDAVMASFRLNGAPRVSGVSFPIVSNVTRPKLATQVRRLRSVR
jgi:hypothetical protein